MSAAQLTLVVVAALLANTPAQRFSVRAESVRLDVIVTDRGRPETGLTDIDFHVLDNGRRQMRITVEQIADAPLDVALAVDVSGSIHAETLAQFEWTVTQLRASLRTHDRLAVMKFSHRVELISDFGQIDSRLDLSRPLSSRGTSVRDAVMGIGALRWAPDSGSLAILLTDGIDTASWAREEWMEEYISAAPVVVYTIAPSGSERGLLGRIAARTGGALLSLGDGRAFHATLERIVSEFRNRYVISYQVDVSQAGWHSIDVRVPRRNVVVRTRSGYLVGR